MKTRLLGILWCVMIFCGASANAQTISTIAGNGVSSSAGAGDGGLATAASIDVPTSIATDASGNVYFSQSPSNRVRKINAITGIITTICGNGTATSTGDGGLATTATIRGPYGIAINASGDIYITEDLNGNRIRKIDAITGIITTICGNGVDTSTGDGGLAINATISRPVSICFDAAGNIYISSFGLGTTGGTSNGSRIRKITVATGIITTICGNGTQTSTGDNGLAINATINNPVAIALDASDNIYFVEQAGNRVRKITATTGIITTICGNGSPSSAGDNGLAVNANVNFPTGLDINKITGDIYIAEQRGHRIRKITATTGIITTICGNGTASSTGDGGFATNATLSHPSSIYYVNNKIYIGEYLGYRIRVITNCPTITINPTNLPVGAVSSFYSQTLTQTGLVGTPIWSISTGALPSGLTIASGTGVISGTPTVGGTFNFTVSVTNGAGCTQTRSYSIVVACAAIVINPSTSNLPNGTVGSTYSQTVTQTGLIGTPIWSISAGVLPSGVSISGTSGIISGAPTAAGTFGFTVSVTNGAGCIQTRSYTIVVTCPIITFINTTALGATVGIAYNLNASASNATAYAVSPALPAGLTLNTATGAISGTPIISVTSTTYTITASRGACTATQGYTFAVICPTIVFTNTTALDATVGSIYNLNAGVTGNTQPVVYSILPALSAGLGINTITGVISGTPTVATINTIYTITATQGACIVTNAYAFSVICPIITVTPALTTQNYTVGTAISAITLGVSGVTSATYTVTSGNLPAGITLANGVISGTPITATVSGSFTITATSSIGACTGTQTYNYTVVCPPLVFTVITTNNAVVGTPYTLNAGVTGNTAILTYSVNPTLPAGLSINTATGIISGTPMTITTSTVYTISADQSGGACIKTQTYTFGVTCVLFALLPDTNFLPNGFVGVPYVGVTFAPAVPVAGVTYKYFKRNAINWQTGLTLNEDTGTISGTPSFSTSITVVIEVVNQITGCGSILTSYTLVVFPDPTTAVDDSLENIVKISPNPSSGDFNVDFGTINMAKSSVRVYDTQGKVVFTSENNSNLMVISLDKLANGIYLLEVKTENERITKRLSKTN